MAHATAHEQADLGHGIAQPQLVETLTMAQGLAQLRDRWQAAFHAHSRGHALGQAPRVAGQPPIVADAVKTASALRFGLSDSQRRTRKFDIRRKPAHLRASRFCHQMTILDTDFSSLATGPDFVAGLRTDLLHEEWQTGWSPHLEGKLIAVANLGVSVAKAAAARLAEHRAALADQGRDNDLPALLYLYLTGLRAGLGAHFPSLATALNHAAARSSDFAGLAEVIRRLQAIGAATGPMSDPAAPDLMPLVQRAFGRLVYLCNDLPQTPPDDPGSKIEALSIVAGMLRGGQAAQPSSTRMKPAVWPAKSAQRSTSSTGVNTSSAASSPRLASAALIAARPSCTRSTG